MQPRAVARVLAAAVAGAAALRATVGDARPALQPGVVDVRLTPIADTTIDRLSPGAALGAASSLSLGRDVGPDGTTRTVLLRFGLPEMAAGSLVVTATLTLQRTEAAGIASVAAVLASLSEPFDERTANWANRPDIARQGAAAYVASTPGPLRFDVAWAVEEALRAQRHLGLQLEVPAGGCEAGRSRTFASREQPSGAPELRLAYVGPGTPHPFPSPTASRTPTPTATPTGTRPATATATPSSQRTQPAPMTVIEPPPGAVLPPPVGADAWVVRWRQHAPTLCTNRIVLAADAGGERFAALQDRTRATCFTFTLERPGAPATLPPGRYRWRVTADCPPFGGQQADGPPFDLVAAAPTAPPATAAATPGASASPAAAPTVRPTSRATATDLAPAAPTAVPSSAAPSPPSGASPRALYLPVARRERTAGP